jgi:soluble lytic murein transglycosylase-like protein
MKSAMRTALFRASAVALLVVAAASPTALFAKPKASATHASNSSAHGKQAGGKHVRVAKGPSASFLARDAFYSGDFAKAYELAPAAGERWIAGLASYRMHSYVEAFQYFQAVAQDETADAWSRSGAAYWAARSAVDAGLTSVETPLLRQAASYPWTFYGMIAERQLGLEPVATFAQIVTSPDVRLARAKAAATVQPIEIAVATTDAVELVKIDDVSVKADDAGTREFAAVAATPDAAAAAYPVPDLAPTDGFTVDPALVYAIIRQESRFTPEARSRVGAVGLMQVMPETAVLTTGEARYRRDRAALREPATNMKIGQAYLNILTTDKVGDDLLMVIAGYNGGPGAAQKARERGGNDPLMQIEALPAKETREYVERVMAGYWLYRRQFGQNTPSLDALAAGARISVGYDKASNPAARVQQAEVSLPSPVTRAAPTDAATTVATVATF